MRLNTLCACRYQVILIDIALWITVSIEYVFVIVNTTDLKAEGTRGDHWRDLRLCETGKGQQVAKIHDSWIIIIIIIVVNVIVLEADNIALPS